MLGAADQMVDHVASEDFFFDWKRHRDILIDKKKYKKKDEESSRHRKLNYSKLH